MRMSDIANTETMKVSEAAERLTSAKDNASNSEASEPSQSCRDEHDGGSNKQRTFENEERGAKDQAEEESSCDKVHKPEKAPRKMLSRDSSQDYTDSTGIDLHEFLVNTLKSNPRDRIMLLKLEQDILDFISNNESQKRKFPPMTSYHRMLLHRVAAYFGMDHKVDPSGKSVVINKTTNTRIPDQKFSEHISDDRVDDFQKRYILKRDNSSFDRDDSMIRMRLKADKRSKSMEEREEEYQRARERIFAHDGDHFIIDRGALDENCCLSSQQRRQMFRLRAGQSGASRQSSSETETLPRHGEPRPWSSTDSSDSSNRLAPRPAITKASSFSGISPGLIRGDSTASSKSTGRLSKTGSESCSSVGSSSSSLSRPQLPLPAPASSRPGVHSTPLIQPAADSRGAAHLDATKSLPPHPTAADTTNYYVFPLEASGIPPGSVLLNPHTGKPFVHPDGSAVVYNPAGVGPAAGRLQQQGKSPPQPLPAAPQQHFYPQPEVLSAQFSHMTLAQQPPGDGAASTPEGRHYPPMYGSHPSPMVLQGAAPQQVTGYMVAGPSGGVAVQLPGQAPNHAYPSSNSAVFSAAPLNQPLLQQHTYIQQPVQQQISSCYCASGHHPHCSHQQQHYRPPTNPPPYNCPQSQNLPQQQAQQALMPNPASSYQTVLGMQAAPGLALTGNQQSNMANQVQGMMVPYPPMQSYQQSYQQPIFVSCQPTPVAGMQPCYSLLPPNQHTTMSSTVSFLPGPVMEQLQFSQTSSPCISQQHPGQQYAGLLPPAPGGGGMVMLQMTGPPYQQHRAPSPCQRKPAGHKQPGPEQPRGRRPAEMPPPADGNAQSSLPSSPALTPSPCPPLSIKGFPVLSHQLPPAFCHTGQGEAHYSLLGQPVQYKPSIRGPLIHATHMVTKHQGPLGVWRSSQGRKASRKPLSSDLSVSGAGNGKAGGRLELS
uniref:R3H domain containing 1 n=1 Tax=Oryzias latipes TaxID=8090 RepID=A0A3P9I8C5_ORYLA